MDSLPNRPTDEDDPPDYHSSVYDAFHLRWFKMAVFYRNHVLPYFRIVFATAGLVSGVILVIDFGFSYSKEYNSILFIVVQSVLVIFVLYEFLGWIFTDQSVAAHFKQRAFEIVLAGLVAVQLIFRDIFVEFLFPEKAQEGGEQAALLFLAVSQSLFVLNLVIHASRNSGSLRSLKIHPSVVFMQSFTIVIVIGTALLRMPRASLPSVPLVDLFFTAVSATCVTGLSTIDISTSLTRTGQIILLSLIQIGGLGLMTLTSFFSFYLAGRASLTQEVFMKTLLSEDSLSEARKIVRSIAVMTVIIESIGAVNLYFMIPESVIPLPGERLFVAIFTSISAFCNAGFSLLPDSLLTLSQVSPFSIYVVMALIVLGGLGFPVIRNVLIVASPRRRGVMPRRLEFTSKIVLITTGIMLVFGFAGFYLLERNGALKSLSASDTFLHSLFYSVASRTAGFSTLSLDKVGVPVSFFIMLLMWVGASPISTGGGIKTTTIAVAAIHIITLLRGRSRIEIFKRAISESTVVRAYSTVLLSFVVIFTGIFAITLVDDENFLDVAFEVVSAYSTTGLSLGISERLSFYSKLILSAIMLIGLVGVLSFFISIVPAAQEQRYQYPVEYVVVG